MRYFKSAVVVCQTSKVHLFVGSFNLSPTVYYYYVDTYICRTSVLGKAVNTGKTLAIGKPSTGRKTYVRLEGTYM